MTFTIENNVPIPTVNKSGGRTPKYPFGLMVVGNSFFAEVPEAEAKQIQRAAAAFARRNKVTFTTRRSAVGVRVWRTT